MQRLVRWLPLEKDILKHGEWIRMVDIQEVHAGSVAFAAILADKRVVTWGDQEGGGDSAKVKAELLNVQQVQGKGRAFAALLENGRVVTWEILSMVLIVHMYKVN